jgi:hypothetical protein
MNLSAIIDAMVSAGCSAEQLAAVVKAVEAEREIAVTEKRKADAERQRRHRLSRDVTVTERESRDETVTPSPEVFPHTPFPNPNPDIPSKKDPKGSQKGSPFEALSAVLSPETASAVVEHRQRMRKPLTAYAAKMLAAKFAACPDPNAAADAMIANGWQGFDQAWMQRGHSPPRAKDYTQAANEIIEEMREHERAKSQGIERDVQLFPGLSGRFETEVEYLPAPVGRSIGRGGD